MKESPLYLLVLLAAPILFGALICLLEVIAGTIEQRRNR
jgi:hypothetical protein